MSINAHHSVKPTSGKKKKNACRNQTEWRQKCVSAQTRLGKRHKQSNRMSDGPFCQEIGHLVASLTLAFSGGSLPRIQGRSSRRRSPREMLTRLGGLQSTCQSTLTSTRPCRLLTHNSHLRLVVRRGWGGLCVGQGQGYVFLLCPWIPAGCGRGLWRCS